MKCNKCGMDIADSSRFCGYCGASTIEINNLDKTVKIEPISQNSVQPNSTANPEIKKIENVVVQPKNNVVGPKPVNTGMQPQTNNIPVGQKSVIQSQIQKEVNNPTINNNLQQSNNVVKPNSDNKKGNKLIFIIGGMVLAIIAVVLFVVSFTKSSEGSVNVLKKALMNLQESSVDSGTAVTKISISSSEGVTLDLSASLMLQKKSDDEINLQFKVDKSILSDEINIYGTISKDNVIMYLQSQIVDLAGVTTSETPVWLHQIFPLDELTGNDSVTDSEQLDLSDVIDSKHFVFVENADGLNKYQLIIDQELIDTVNSKLKLEAEEIEEMEYETTLEEPIYIDLYISEQDELKKINMDISNQLKDTELAKFVFSVEFTDFNKTVIEIPEEAKKSTIDLQKYMYDYAVDFNMNNSGSFDINY